MTPQSLNHIEAIFSRVVDLPPGQRATALREACGADEALRAELESLFNHADPPEPFLAGSALGPNFVVTGKLEDNDDQVGRRIGPYCVIERRGSGGMGAVYLAARDDGQFEQRVAIKVVKRGMDSEEILRRFEQERRTLATLNHTNIARLLDGGTTSDARPYLAMEFVDGTPVDQYCDEHHLVTTERLRLFCVICEAVRFAHQQLIIHRDLKPGNILVDHTGVPKLLDFGIAKVLAGADSAEVTAVEERRFTPEYASPEQAAGQPLTTATDIYSLGVILYELLTGRRPYRLKSRAAGEIQRVMLEQQPLAPSTAVASEKLPASRQVGVTTPDEISRVRDGTPDRLRRRLRGDLDTIVLKAMQKDPARRYASVEQLVADIGRHLDGLPVWARPDTVRYRMSKFVRRHALAVALGTSSLLALAGGLGVAIWRENAARHDRDAAYVARDQAEATADFLQRMMSAADPGNAGPDATVRSVLDIAAVRADADLANQPLVQATIRSTIGRTYLGLGLHKEAEQHITAAYHTRLKLLSPGNHDVAESEFDMAQLLYAEGKFAEAEALLTKCLATHQRLRGDENVDTARVWNDLGAVRRAAGKIDEAEAALRRALAIREAVAGPESLEVAETLNNLSGARAARDDMSGAETLMTRALAIRRKILRDEHPLVIQSTANIAVLAARQGDLARSAGLLREVVALDRRVFGAQHPSLAVDLSSLGVVLIIDKHYADAEEPLREALEIRKRRLSSDDVRLLKTQATLGQCLMAQGRQSEGEPLAAEALKAARHNLRAGDDFWLSVIEDLEAAYHNSGRDDLAAEMASIRTELTATD